MSSFGMELEICCWGSPQDLVFGDNPETCGGDLDSTNCVNLLESSPEETLLDAYRPVSVSCEDLHMGHIGLDSGWILPRMTFARMVAPTSACIRPLPSAPQGQSVAAVPSPSPMPGQCLRQGQSQPAPLPAAVAETASTPSVAKTVSFSVPSRRESLTEDENLDGSDTEYTEDSTAPSSTSNHGGATDGEDSSFKLGTSKSPVIEAFIYCALKGWGVHVKKCTNSEVEFTVSDFDRYYSASNKICSKHRPTEDISARIKGLKRWFPDFPARKSQISESFTVSVGKDKSKLAKIRHIVHKNREVAGICKLRRSR